MVNRETLPYIHTIKLLMVKRYGRQALPKKAFDFGFGAGNHLWMLKQVGYEVWVLKGHLMLNK